MLDSNRLPVLAGRVSDLHKEIEGHQLDAARKALDAGEVLCEAKELAGHGNWADWLAGTGIGERTAQRYMRLHRYALNSDTVSDLGGIGAALEWLKPVKLPPAGSVLLVSADDFDPKGDKPMAFVWKVKEGYHLAFLDLRPEWPCMNETKKPICDEFAVWCTLWHMFDWQGLADLRFQMADEIFDPRRASDLFTLLGVDMGGDDSPEAGK